MYLQLGLTARPWSRHLRGSHSHALGRTPKSAHPQRTQAPDNTLSRATPPRHRRALSLLPLLSPPHRPAPSRTRRPRAAGAGPRSAASCRAYCFLVKDSRYSTSFLEPMNSGTRWCTEVGSTSSTRWVPVEPAPPAWRERGWGGHSVRGAGNPFRTQPPHSSRRTAPRLVPIHHSFLHSGRNQPMVGRCSTAASDLTRTDPKAPPPTHPAPARR